MASLLHRDITSQILGSFFRVFGVWGFGFLEPMYANSLSVELGQRGLVVKREVPVQLHYLGVPVGNYRVDMLVNDRMIVEVKAIQTLTAVHERQLMNYLRASEIEVGLLLNFGPVPQHKRLVYSNTKKGFTAE